MVKRFHNHNPNQCVLFFFLFIFDNALIIEVEQCRA